MTTEHNRLKVIGERETPLVQWGPYVSERQWGTVREDYSHDGNAWQYFPFDHAHCRSYQWGEDGIAGISDNKQILCFAPALWNGKDPILKERLFGLSNGEGNHGEDVKELYYHLDNVPSHFYMKYLYKYPQQEFPYHDLRIESGNRSKYQPEYEILDTGVFNDNRYFDVEITYAYESERDIYIRIAITNRYHEAAPITVLPTLWFSNHHTSNALHEQAGITAHGSNSVKAAHNTLGEYYFHFKDSDDALFTNNVTNTEKVTGKPNRDIYVKDAFHGAIIKDQNRESLRNIKNGTKFSPVYELFVDGKSTKTIYCRLNNIDVEDAFEEGFEKVFSIRKKEADEFYGAVLPRGTSKDLLRIQRQALAGLLWSKQYYHFDVESWLGTSDGITDANHGKQTGRNHDWWHLKNQDVILMPDKWEYPWYAAWDLAFQCMGMAMVDPAFAKHQLLLIMREWYMKADGQIPAYEWNFSDVNPPVHAWAALQVYHIEKKQNGKGDIFFLKKIFQKLLVNFNWWISQKDKKGNNIFEGGFLGLDNIGVFNRSYPGSDVQLEQADATGWMGTYALNMMDIALEISLHDPSFEDLATRFFEHFVMIAESFNDHHLWSENDKFFYDVLSAPGLEPRPMEIKSIVGLTSLFAVSTISKNALNKLKDFRKRSLNFERNRTSNSTKWPYCEHDEKDEVLMSLLPPDRLVYLLERMLDEKEFLSEGGIRALSKYHQDHPYSIMIDGIQYTLNYDPGDSTSDMFGGNSNWRGPVWVPINYLFIQSIKCYGEFYGDRLLVEYPARSGNKITLSEVAEELGSRIISLFTKDEEGARRHHGVYNWFYSQEGNENLALFYEYFHGDTGHGLGASHQTGWTALVAELISEQSRVKKQIPEEV